MAKPSRARVIAAAKGALRGYGKMRSLLPEYNDVPPVERRRRELKARLKRARTATVKPKGRLPNGSAYENDKLSGERLEFWKRAVWRAHHHGATDRQAKIFANRLLKIAGYADDQSIKGAWDRWSKGSVAGWQGKKINPSMFGAAAIAKAKRVRTIKRPGARRVIERDTLERGEIVGVQPGGFVKVKWGNRERPTLIKRSEIKRQANPIEDNLRYVKKNGYYYLINKITKQVLAGPYLTLVDVKKEIKKRRKNPGLMELAGGVQALEYLAGKSGIGGNLTRKRKRRNPVAMDAFTKKHLRAWIENSQRREDRVRVGKLIRDFVKRYPELISEGRSWPEILRLAERERENPSSDQERIRNLRLLLAGKKVDGLKLGDPGLSEAWARQHLASLEALEQARKERIRDRQKRRNPSVTEMSERFQGRATGKVQNFYASDSAPRLNFSRAGKLVFLKVGGKMIKVSGVVVAIDPHTQKLWIANSVKRSIFNKKAAHGELLDYGVVDVICYLTAKQHIGDGKTFEYVHTFGEEGGRKPRLLVDHDGMPILKGGDYKIEDRGIVD